MNPYRVIIAGLFDGQPIEEVPPETLSYTDALSDAGSASFDVQKLNRKCSRDLLEPFQRQIQVMKADVMKWRGILGPAQTSAASDVVSFLSIGYFARLMARYLDSDKSYSSDDEFDIAWDLIDFTQTKDGGDLGITRWTSEVLSGIDLTVDYAGADRPYIGQIIRDLAAGDDGFDFEITPDLIWKAYHPAKGVVTNAVFELGKNVLDYGYTIDPLGIATDVTGTGSGSGGSRIVKTANDVTARDTYGLIEAVVDFSDASKGSIVQSLTDAELANRTRPAEQPTITLKIDVDSADTAFATGDQVKVRIADGYIDVDDFFRVLAKTVTVDADGQEQTSVTFESKVV